MDNLEHLIDNSHLENHTPDLTFSHGSAFGNTARIISGITLPLFLLLFISAFTNLNIIGMLVSLFFLFVLTYIVTTHTGVQLCISTSYFKEYTSFIGIKFGKWKHGRGLTDVAILTIRKKKRVSSTFGSVAFNIDLVETGVYFLIATHRKRLLIKICKNKSDAEQSAKELAEKCGKKYAIFSPKVSESTKARMRR